MACKFSLRQLAETDIEEILDYIAADHPQAAVEFYSGLLQLFERVGRFPHMGRERKELMAGVRSMPYGNYVVFYTGQQPVEIVRVLHAARDLKAEFGAMD